MKTISSFLYTTLLMLFVVPAFSQDFQKQESLGLPGDNLNLYAALKVFQESKTLEEFEQKLNDADAKINNLDLDGDNQIDYIQVIDQVKNNVHSIVLRVALDKNEQQDVAVFVVSKEADNKVSIQVIGDEDLYGKNYIIEPNYDDSPSRINPGYTGNNTTIITSNDVVDRRTITYVEVASWPVVQFMFVRTYNPWRSPWSWGYYPTWFRPWQPYAFHWYYGYHYNFRPIYLSSYRRGGFYRNPSWYSWNYGYGGFRSRSTVYITRYQGGFYRNTYSNPQLIREGYNVSRVRYASTPSVNRMPEVRVPRFTPDRVRNNSVRTTERPTIRSGEERNNNNRINSSSRVDRNFDREVSRRSDNRNSSQRDNNRQIERPNMRSGEARVNPRSFERAPQERNITRERSNTPAARPDNRQENNRSDNRQIERPTMRSGEARVNPRSFERPSQDRNITRERPERGGGRNQSERRSN